MARRRTGRKPGPRQTAGYAVSQANGVFRIVPRPLSGPGLMGRSVAGILACVAVAVIGGWVWWAEALTTRDAGKDPMWWFAWVCPGGLFLLLAAILLAASAKLWWFRNTPLLIDPTGRVRYGRRELIPAGSAKTVRLDKTVRCDTDDSGTRVEEIKMCLVYVEGTDGQFKALPEPYFSGFDGWEVGQELAKALAKALRVPFSTGPVPVAVPTPGGK